MTKWKLDPYQEESRDFLLERDFAGLFDAPGVGKTAPTIMAAWEKVKESGDPALITAPAYLLSNWRKEIHNFIPEARVVLANGQGQETREEALAAEADFVLTSYNNWSAGKGKLYTYPDLWKRTWAAYVFDEGHRLRGRNSKSTKHVQQVRRVASPNRSTPLWTLTGTPIVNNPGDLYPLLNMWDRRRFRSYWAFVNEWCVVKTNPWATEVGQLKPGKDSEFHELLSEFAMRRTLKDVASLADLEETHTSYEVELPVSVRKTIAKARREYQIAHEDLAQTEFVSGGGALYARLRQLATDPPTVAKPKIDLVRDLLEDIGQDRLVVYVWYKSSARAVSEGLTKTNRPITLVTGDVPTDKRGELVDEWKNSRNGVLIATISSLKEGISLTSASNVIFVEHSELPADQEQCIARLKRRGQTRLVRVHHVYAKATPDVAIMKAVVERETGLRRALTDWLEGDE